MLLYGCSGDDAKPPAPVNTTPQNATESDAGSDDDSSSDDADGDSDDDFSSSDDTSSDDWSAGDDLGTDDSSGDDSSGDDSSSDDSSGDDTSSDDSSGDDQPPAVRPPCIDSPSQVVLVGDSYINWPIAHTFPADLTKEVGEEYRDYAVGGYSMGSGGIGSIPAEFDQALKDDPNILAAIMTGGGNDILVADGALDAPGGCKNLENSPTLPECQNIVQTAIDAADGMLHTAADAGVKDVIYFFYPHVPDGTLVGGAHPNAILDYALPLVRDFCDTAEERSGVRCHFVDMIPVFDGHLDDWFFPLDIHPNTTGSAAMAKAVHETMVAACIGQHADSGCCEP